MTYLLFFFHRYATLRFLHSFPTRRSSDLFFRGEDAATAKQAQRQYYQYTIPSLLDAVRVTAGQDRKSTRLNSSHITISYAVFCLKKKKLPSLRRLAQCQRNSTSHRRRTSG